MRVYTPRGLLFLRQQQKVSLRLRKFCFFVCFPQSLVVILTLMTSRTESAMPEKPEAKFTSSGLNEKDTWDENAGR